MIRKDAPNGFPVNDEEIVTRMIFAYYNMGPENGKKFMEFVKNNPSFNFEDYTTWGDWSKSHYEYSNYAIAIYRFYQDILKS